MISLYLVIYDVIAVNAAYFLGLWFRFDCTYSAIPGEYLSAYLKFTKPTTITVVAEEDWITAVTPAPNNTAIIRFEVSFSRRRSIRPPDSFESPAPIASIP